MQIDIYAAIKKNVPPTVHYILHFAESVRRWGPLVQVWLFQFERYNNGMVNATRNNKYAMASMIKHMRIRRWKAMRFRYCTAVESPGRADLDQEFSGSSPTVSSLIFQSISYSNSKSLRRAAAIDIGSRNPAADLLQQDIDHLDLQRKVHQY